MSKRKRKIRKNKQEIRKSKKVRLVLVGGFLGAGKTTLIVALGKRLITKGKKVALITNDQGEFLVDTAYAGAEGFSTSEVLNGCFCCRFPDFMKALSSLTNLENLDIIFAEPVGSCTDLLGTVVAPLRAYYADKFELAPLMIVVDTKRFAEEYSHLNLKKPKKPLEYLLSHQLGEAQVFCLSKIDMVDNEKIKRAKEVLQSLNPHAQIVALSSKTGEGLDELHHVIYQRAIPKMPNPVDYDVYAKAEAELGWYNGTVKISKEKDFDPLDFTMKILKKLGNSNIGKKIVHAKVFGVSNIGSFKLSSVDNVIQGDGVCSEQRSKDCSLTLNIRAKCNPKQLASEINRVIKQSAKEYDIRVENYIYSSKIPPPPEPYFRMLLSPKGL